MTTSLPDPLPVDPRERLAVIGAVLADRVEAAIPAYVTASIERILDAWGRLDPEDCQAVIAAADRVGPAVAAQVGQRLRTELARPAPEQRVTPLEITARLVTEPTVLLQRQGIPSVVRDPQAEALHPEDAYDLVPRALTDLGDPELGPLQLAWGLAKHAALRENR